MFKKSSNTKLIIILIVLLGIVGIYMFLDSRKGERNFPKDMGTIDSAKVTEITMLPRTKKEVKLFKKDTAWFVSVNDKKSAEVANDRMRGVFSQLNQMVPKSLAATDKNKWKDFEIDDSLAVHVKVMEGSKVAMDIYVGKYSFNQQARSIASYVRLAGDDRVYIVDGFLQASFGQESGSWRNQGIIKSDIGTWAKMSFSYPADSSFSLEKKEKTWTIAGEKTDSAKTMNYLSSIGNLNGTEFADDFDPKFSQPLYKLNILDTLGKTIDITVYGDTSKLILNSSINKASYFDAKKGDIAGRIFVGKSRFN